MNLRHMIGSTVEPHLFSISGTLEGWREVATMLFAPGCEAQSVLLLASFAAPLMSLLPTQEGGAFVSIHGGKRSGKDLALLAAETVWGNPPSSTEAGFLHDAPAELENLPVIYSGLAHRDPSATRRAIVDSVEKSPAVTWRTLFLSAGPTPVFYPAFERGETQPGLELPVKVPSLLIDPKADKRLRHELEQNQANAGYVYLRYLVKPSVIGWCKKNLVSTIAAIGDEHGDVMPRRFEVRAIAAIVTAAHVVRKTEIIDVDPERIRRWLIDKTFPKKKVAT